MDEAGRTLLKSSTKKKTVFDPALYEPNNIRAGMDDALKSYEHGKSVLGDKGSWNSVGKVTKKDGTVVDMHFKFFIDPVTGEIRTAYPIQ